MEQRLSSRFWIILVAGFLVVIGLGLLLALLARRPGEPIPTNAPVPSTRPPAATAATSPISPLPTRPAADSPIPTSQPPYGATIPEIAPDFALNQAGGGEFDLSEHLARGPVVLVFFQRVGG